MNPKSDPEGYDNRERSVIYRIRTALLADGSPHWYRAQTAQVPYYLNTELETLDRAEAELVLGETAERRTHLADDFATRAGRWFHAFAPEDQLFCDLITRTVQRAASWFYDPEWKPLVGVANIVISDADVRERVRRIDLGENTREANRIGKNRYPLQELPFQQQRAMVEQIEALKREFGFEFVGEETP